MSIRGGSLALGSKPRLITRIARSGLRKRLGSKLPRTSVCLKLVRRILDSSQSSLHLYAVMDRLLETRAASRPRGRWKTERKGKMTTPYFPNSYKSSRASSTRFPQPRPQGLLVFQQGGEDPGDEVGASLVKK